MGAVQVWVQGIAAPRRSAGRAARLEAAGWDGMSVVDSQNLSGDCWVALALAATSTTRLGLGTAVTNPVTRHPAVSAAAAASVHAASDGRVVLGIGRGDSALAHLGRAPAPVRVLERYVAALQAYLRGEEVPFEDVDVDERLAPPVEGLGLADAPTGSRLLITSASRRPKVPVEVAATGPKVIGVAARLADRVMLAVGADPERVRWGVETVRAARAAAGLDPDGVAVGAYVTAAADPDVAAARDLVRGGVSTHARFSVMHGTPQGPVDDEQRSVLTALHDGYDMTRHTQAGSAQADLLTPSFIDRFSVVGPSERCAERLRALVDLGLDKLVVGGPTDATSDGRAGEAAARFAEEVLPALRA